MAGIDWDKGSMTPPAGGDSQIDWESGAITPPGEKPKGPGAIRKAADLATGFVGGAIGATKALTDVAGAGNDVSNALESANKSVEGWLSPQARAGAEERATIMKDAEGKGVYEGVKAGLTAFANDPLQVTAGGLGSIVPTVVIGAATGGAGAVASRAAQVGSGLAMGAGTTKGAIYDDIKKRSLESGMTPEAAEAAATQAQSYGGGNTDQIALGAALGMADAATGVTPIVTNMARKALGKEVVQSAVKGLENTAADGILKRVGKGVLGEMPLEATQGGQEQLATNIAAQRAGYDAGTWDNVASNATLEGLASAGPGAGFGALAGKGPAPVQPPPVEPPAADPGVLRPEHNPGAGTATVFPDGSIVLNSDTSNGAKTVRDMQRANRLANAANPFFGDPAPAKPSEAMGLEPTAGPSLANAAILSVDTGIHQAAAEEADPYNAPLSALGQELSKTNQRLRQEADALGLDTEGLHGDAARMTDGKPHEDYLMAANDQLRKAMKAAKEIPDEGQRGYSDDPARGGETKGPDAQAGKAPAGNADGPVGAGAVRPSVDRVGEHGQRAAGTDGGNLPGAVAAPTRDQAIAKASDAAGKVLASGGTDADANRAATDSLIDQMATTPGIAIAQDAPAAVKAAKGQPPANNNAQTTTSAPAAPAAGLPAAGSAAVQADGVKPSREVADAAGIATSVLGKDTAAKGRFADFADAHAGKPASEVQSLLSASEFGPKLAVNELAQISDQISKSGSGVARQARANAAPQVEASDSQKLANKIKFQKIRVEQAGAAVSSAQDVDQFGLPIENGPKKQAAKARLQKAEADLAALESTQPQGTPTNAASPENPGTQASQAPSTQGAAPAGTAVAKPKNALQKRIQKDQQARADYFTPGNIVKGYSGHDRVIGYTPPVKDGGSWSVRVQAVVKQGDKWVNDPKDNRERQHSTPPDAKELASGPVFRNPVQPQGATSEPQADQAGQAAAQPAQAGPAAGVPAEGAGAVEAAGVEPAKAPTNRTAYVAEVRRQLGDLQPGDVLENDMGDKWTVDVVMRNKAGEVTGFLPREINPETGEREVLDLDVAGSVLLPSPYLDASGNRKLSQPGKVNRAQPATLAHQSQPNGAHNVPQADQAQQAEAQRPQKQPAAAGPVATANPKIKAAPDKKNEADAEPVAARTATEHAGLKIYPTKVKVGAAVVDMWGVQTPDNARREKNGERQIGGDPLSETLDGAKKNAEAEVRDAKSRAEREAESKAADDAAQAKKDANKGKSILQRRAVALLDKQHTYPPQAGLGQGTRREAMQKAVDQGRAIVERMVPDTAAKHRDQTAIDLVKARGYILGLSNENIPVVKQGLEAQARMKANQYEKPEYRVYDSAKTDGGFYEITKTEFDYAKSLEGKPGEPSSAQTSPVTNPANEPTAEQIAAIGDITIEVPTENGTAKMTVNAAKALAHIDERMDALEMVQRCLG